MRLTIVGCSGSLPGPDSPASSYLVEAGGTRLVLDIGNGAIGALQRFAALDAVDAVLLSHTHGDHCLDLCGWFVHRRYGPGLADKQSLPVFGPSGTAERIAAAYGGTTVQQLSQEFQFQNWTSGIQVQVGSVTVVVARVDHPGEAYAMRLEHDGHVLVYSGDTGPTEALVNLARGADVLLCEAGFADGRTHAPGVHLTGAQAGEHAARGGVKNLVLTHIAPWIDPEQAKRAAQSTFAGPVEVARQGLVIDV